MRALAQWRDDLCPLCGGPRSECQDPGAEFRYVGSAPTRCHRRTAILRAQDDWIKQPGAGLERGLLWGVVER